MAFKFSEMLPFVVGVATGLVMSYLIGLTTNPYSSVVFSSRTLLRVDAEVGNGSVIDGPSASSPAGNNTEGFINRPPLSHEDLDRLPGLDQPIRFEDKHAHHDDTSIADALYKQVRVFCWVMTSPENLRKKAIHVRETWGKRCNRLLFVSDKEDKNFPAIGIGAAKGRDHLTAKTMGAFDYLYEHHLEDADWFMKADDDTYVILENMRYLLSSHDPKDAIYFGHQFKVIVRQGYMSGGGGYVLSKEALTRYGKRRDKLCAKDNGAEDVEMGRCMEKLEVKPIDSRDSLGRTRFHCFNPETHLHGGYPDWYYQYDKYGAQQGSGNMSDYAVTFHYVSVQQMYDIEYYVYHLRPYGIVSGHQDLNKR